MLVGQQLARAHAGDADLDVDARLAARNADGLGISIGGGKVKG
jgi:hypothetical protein